MGVKLAKAFGANVVLFTTSPGKTADAMRLGADEVVISKNDAEMQKHARSFNFILDTVSAQHDVNAYLNLLKLDGTLTLVGAPEKPLPVAAFQCDSKPPQFFGLGNRRHPRDTGDARFLRGEGNYRRYRDDQNPADQ